MTITYGDVRRWDADALDRSATALRARRDEFVALQDELERARRLGDWHGAAADGARASLTARRNEAEVIVAELSAVARALDTASDDVSALLPRVADNDHLADHYEFRIGADGSITDVRPPDPPPRSRFEAEERAEIRRHRAGIMRDVAQETAAILTTANAIDGALAAVMQLAQDRRISDHGATRLADAAKGGELDAGVAEMEKALRDAGLLTGPPPTGAYRQWLENAVLRGVSVDRLMTMVADSHLTPEDFAVLDGLEEIREDQDHDGIFKSFFLLPTDISGDDAAKAVRMTYVLNAGTDYGAGERKTDFVPTPYGSQELKRIADRQQKNDWSYDGDVAFVHGNGGRLMTTPNGMLVGLGGNDVQDLYSQGGGSTYGDIYLVNIDDPQDAAQQLRRLASSGRIWSPGDGARASDLDLDPVLHHEERHSQQWASAGFKGFLGSYLWERITGGNETEEGAGLSDGGYR